MATSSPSWQARNILDQGKPFTSGEIAKLFNVHPRTVTRWAKAQKLEHFKTLGGHRRYTQESVFALFKKLGLTVPEDIR